ncbi:MAG: PD-(D/E)XK nuclease family protein [Methylococcaceae bacterium]|nr:PD-(D/E)XK nuclease family protein [Methylococcaceae bacterium]
MSERDVDFLLVEEFVSSPDFVQWFLQRIDAATREPVEVVRCRRSATDSIGESDVEVFVHVGDEIVAILIEDKVHAAAQPRQAERYRERGEGHVRAGRCQRVITVLIAPQVYLGGKVRGFDKAISYEDLVDWFKHSDGAPMRSHFKATVLCGAIEKATKGYQAVEDEPVTRFWQRYWERSQVIAPELEMKKPGGVPARTGFAYFRPGRVPKGSCIVHKMPHGFIDIQFNRMAERLDELRQRYEPLEGPGVRIERAGKSGVIRIDVVKLRPTHHAEEQLEKIDECLRRATELLAWFRSAEERCG